MRNIPLAIFRPNFFLTQAAELFESGFNMFKGTNIDTVGLRQITCKSSESIPYTPETKWTALGYKEGNNGKLFEVGGKIMTDQENEVAQVNENPQIFHRLSDKVLVMDVKLEEGMSGGPWILEPSMPENAVWTGCQAESTVAGVNPRSLSPQFSLDLFANILYA